MILLYSGVSRSKSLNGGDVGDWNREHTWAKSHGDFGEATGPGTDLHHLRPADVQVNSIRGNLDFDNGGSAVTNGGGSTVDSDSFAPRAADRGDVARMILYMAVRYEGDDGFADLEPNEKVGNGSNPVHGQALRPQGVERGGPAERLRGEAQPGHLRHLPAQPQPVHRPPGVGRGDLVGSSTRVGLLAIRGEPDRRHACSASRADGDNCRAAGRDDGHRRPLA